MEQMKLKEEAEKAAAAAGLKVCGEMNIKPRCKSTVKPCPLCTQLKKSRDLPKSASEDSSKKKRSKVNNIVSSFKHNNPKRVGLSYTFNPHFNHPESRTSPNSSENLQVEGINPRNMNFTSSGPSGSSKSGNKTVEPIDPTKMNFMSAGYVHIPTSFYPKEEKSYEEEEEDENEKRDRLIRNREPDLLKVGPVDPIDPTNMNFSMPEPQEYYDKNNEHFGKAKSVTANEYEWEALRDRSVMKAEKVEPVDPTEIKLVTTQLNNPRKAILSEDEEEEEWDRRRNRYIQTPVMVEPVNTENMNFRALEPTVSYYDEDHLSGEAKLLSKMKVEEEVDDYYYDEDKLYGRAKLLPKKEVDEEVDDYYKQSFDPLKSEKVEPIDASNIKLKAEKSPARDEEMSDRKAKHISPKSFNENTTEEDVTYENSKGRHYLVEAAKPATIKSDYMEPIPENKAEVEKAEVKQAEIKKAEAEKAELKQAEVKLAEAKKAEAKKAEAKQAEIKKADAKKAELKLAEIKKADAKKAELKLAEMKKAEAKKAELKLSEMKKAEAKKAELKLAEMKKAEAKKAELKLAEMKKAEEKRAELKLAEIKLAEMKKAEAKRAELKLAEIKLAEIKKAEAKRAELKLAEMRKAVAKRASVKLAEIKKAEAIRAELKLAEVKLTEAKKGEVKKAEVKSPEEKKAEGKKVEVKKAEVTQADGKKPEEKKPQVKKAQEKKPEVKTDGKKGPPIINPSEFESVKLKDVTFQAKEGYRYLKKKTEQPIMKVPLRFKGPCTCDLCVTEDFPIHEKKCSCKGCVIKEKVFQAIRYHSRNQKGHLHINTINFEDEGYKQFKKRKLNHSDVDNLSISSKDRCQCYECTGKSSSSDDSNYRTYYSTSKNQCQCYECTGKSFSSNDSNSRTYYSTWALKRLLKPPTFVCKKRYAADCIHKRLDKECDCFCQCAEIFKVDGECKKCGKPAPKFEDKGCPKCGKAKCKCNKGKCSVCGEKNCKINKPKCKFCKSSACSCFKKKCKKCGNRKCGCGKKKCKSCGKRKCKCGKKCNKKHCDCKKPKCESCGKKKCKCGKKRKCKKCKKCGMKRCHCKKCKCGKRNCKKCEKEGKSEFSNILPPHMRERSDSGSAKVPRKPPPKGIPMDEARKTLRGHRREFSTCSMHAAAKKPCDDVLPKKKLAKNPCVTVKTNCPPRKRDGKSACSKTYKFRKCKPQAAPFKSFAECRPPIKPPRLDECRVKKDKREEAKLIVQEMKTEKGLRKLRKRFRKYRKNKEKGKKCYSTYTVSKKIKAFHRPKTFKKPSTQ